MTVFSNKGDADETVGTKEGSGEYMTLCESALKQTDYHPGLSPLLGHLHLIHIHAHLHIRNHAHIHLMCICDIVGRILRKTEGIFEIP